MFENIGGKLKALALITCIVGIAASVITGFAMIADGESGGIIVIIAGSLASWVGSLFTYGFGELIDYTIAIYGELYNKTKKEERKEAIATATECKYCGYKIEGGRSSCPSCGRKQ